MLKPYPQCDGVRGWGPTTEEEKSPELPLSLPGEDTPYGGHLPARKRVLTRSPLWCHPDLRPSSPPNCEKGRSERPPSLSPSGQAVRQTSAPTGSGQAPSALSPTQGPAALTPWCPGTTEQRPRGLSGPAPLHPLSRRDSELPPRGDTSRHSSNLELFCPYQLVSAGLPDTCSHKGGALSGGFPAQERASTVQHGYLPATEKGRRPLGTLFPTGEGGVARGPAPPLFQASSSSFFPGPTPGMWPEPESYIVPSPTLCPAQSYIVTPSPTLTLKVGPAGGAGLRARSWEPKPLGSSPIPSRPGQVPSTCLHSSPQFPLPSKVEEGD